MFELFELVLGICIIILISICCCGYIWRPFFFITYIQYSRKHFVVDPIYYEDSDILKISFINFTPPVIKIEKTEMKDIKVGVDNDGKVVSLLS
ncbi:hypothetical protein RCL_jg6695.t1 [Rhizophagus clarus]|uniref:Uncharacterized protein n=1 Tax=Rhizophagus clarus TaxID=94130 RepID=A0A8H3QMZ1_9GLOM|nr:hypothetical protein RCL_jg6695.t1 [Rhizophagus clarus]